MFKDNEREGYGELKWTHGDRYEGMWKEGKKHGEGEYNYQNGYFFR